MTAVLNNQTLKPMKLLKTIATAAIISSSLFVLAPAEAFWWGSKKKQENRTPAKTLDYKRMISDYNSNESRFNTNWVWHFLKHRGAATDIGSQAVSHRFTTYEPSMNKNIVVEVSCEIDTEDFQNQIPKINKLNLGDSVTFTGRLDGRDFNHVVKGGQNIYLISLTKCRLL